MPGKLNIIDHDTHKKIRQRDGKDRPDTTKMLRNSKYKNKHKKPEQQQCTLFDFIRVPRQKPKQSQLKKRLRPHLTITRNPIPKRKGKTRLNPKHKDTRLKKSILSYRKKKEAIKQREEELLTSTNQVSLPQVEEQLQQLSLESEKPHSIHSRRFRGYCDNCTRPQLKELTTLLLKDLVRFQKRAHAHNEIKARAHPRLVVGFREALSRLRINKVKLLIMATDCEMCPGERGLDETIDELKSICQQQNVPYCFSLVRRELAYVLQKRAQISCVAILDYDGANVCYKDLLEELKEARVEYKRLTSG